MTELPEFLARRVEHVNALLPQGMQIDTTPILDADEEQT